jgi:hypothetical protein
LNGFTENIGGFIKKRKLPVIEKGQNNKKNSKNGHLAIGFWQEML